MNQNKKINLKKYFNKRQLNICEELNEIGKVKKILEERESLLKAEFWALNNSEKAKAFMKAKKLSDNVCKFHRLFLLNLLRKEKEL